MVHPRSTNGFWVLVVVKFVLSEFSKRLTALSSKRHKLHLLLEFVSKFGLLSSNFLMKKAIVSKYLLHLL